MNTRYLSVMVALAFLGFSVQAAAHPCHRDPGEHHKHCKGGEDPPDPDPTTTYTAELTGRVFSFGPVAVVPDEKLGTLYPDPDVDGTLTFSRPPGDFPCDPNDPAEEAACAWDAVFAACENFFGPNPVADIGPTTIVVESFQVPAGNWSIQKPGGVRIGMSIPFDQTASSPPDGQTWFTVHLQLIGNTFFDDPNDTSWLPDPTPGENPKTIEHPIFDFSIIGRTQRGVVRPKKGCVSGGTAEGGDFDPAEDATDPEDTERFIEIEAFDAS